MKWFKRVLIGVIGLVVVLAGIGLILPAKFKVERSVQIAAPVDKIYALIADPREWKRWSIWNQRDPQMQVEYGGSPTGAGARWSWRSQSEGSGEMEFTEAVPGQRLAYRLNFPEFGMQSRGLLRLEPQGSAVRVSWSNEGEMSANPMNRWFGFFMDGLVGPDFAAGLANLKRLAEQG